DKYRLEVNTASDFTGTVVFDDAALTTNSQALSGLSYNTTYYWRVTAQSNLAKVSTSTTNSFTTQLISPVLSPVPNTAIGQALNITLSWSSVTGADVYTLEVNTASDFSGTAIAVSNQPQSGTSKAPGGLSDNTTYYWRVTASNSGTGNTSNASTVGSFITARQSIGDISPTQNSFSNSLTPTLSWSKIVGADKFRLEVNDKSDFTGEVIFNSTITNTSQQIGISPTLSHNTKYYWRVTAQSNLAKVTTSATNAFTTKLATPTLTFPADNAAGVSLTPTLTWSSVTGADKYRLEVNTTSDFTGTVVYDNNDLTNENQQIGSLSESTQYFWRVTAMTNAGNSGDVSSVSDFTTLVTAPTNLGSNAIDINKILLTWIDNSNSEDGYKLERTEAEGSVFTLLKDLQANINSFVDSTVEEGKHYKYRVKAYIQNTESVYSNETIIFTPISSIDPPSEVKVEPDTLGNFVIEWKDNSNNEDGFIIQRGIVDSGNTTSNIESLFKMDSIMDFIPIIVAIDTVPSNTTIYVDTDTEEGISYQYQVEAFNSDGVSLSKTDTTKTTVSALIAPSNLTAIILGATLMKVKLEWVNNSQISFGVIIERSDNDSTNYVIVDSVGNSISSYTDSLLNIGHTYYYRIKAYNPTASSAYVFVVSGIITDVESLDNLIPKEFTLEQNYPNPFNPSTIIRFGLSEASFVILKIYNMLGQEVKTLINKQMNTGTFNVQWRGDNDSGNKVSSGIYIYRVMAGSHIFTKKMILLK
ncbi:MAG: T9SS type A sorting domain-containing protein, partial [Bacteroidetes bacterium]|nr:T9SS type A sorting domain-containing protein [Bacteroidota bacterium]